MRSVVVRRSPVHGKGVFALRTIKAGERILEYKGEVTMWDRAVKRYQRDGRADGHTFFFGLSDGRVIDGERGGNSARWLNHACVPNCETVEEGQRVFVIAAADISTGDELFIDYQLSVEGRRTEAVRAAYRCLCGAAGCRGSMLGHARKTARSERQPGRR
ncbi:SET domain-containing protein [Paraburkholderia lacunae]|uniref:SET domain-containing protein-lysine N-methyltransferase n=1 Tax=Paraburkholderia lacunae TaxID=2211104 RepID=A0A370N0D4_9BURK|nr:SET domain-containing protein-lysine N-methyltransferase [Paraburkholderia lacunae]RDJ99080.1 SET domain-containing protein-lysine N-methyltransferase [Paraburkholderia lacunae]